MGKVHDGIDGPLADWIARQHMFFVATATSDTDGTVNVSPKGTAGTLVVLDEHRVAYLDLTGSGIETVAHLRENGRITLMWCAFEGPPRIVRVHGRGEVVTTADDSWDALLDRFGGPRPGQRSIIVVTARRVSDSCGYSVPLMDFSSERTRLDEWAAARTEDDLDAYRARKNARSIDGLPGL
jgi:predicted pyridoxine 5'-phosphate oxidase superfamily flavin-nucleotide-binding protein